MATDRETIAKRAGRVYRSRIELTREEDERSKRNLAHKVGRQRLDRRSPLPPSLSRREIAVRNSRSARVSDKLTP